MSDPKFGIDLDDLHAACRHPTIEPSTRYADGSVDGRCTACGEDGFPIRDVPYERFVADEAAERCAPAPCSECGTALARDDEGTWWCPQCWGTYRWPRWAREALRRCARRLEEIAGQTHGGRRSTR